MMHNLIANQIWGKVGYQIRTQIMPIVRMQTGNQIWYQVMDQAETQLMEEFDA